MKHLIRSAFCIGLLWLDVGCASTRQYVRLPDQTRNIENSEQSRIYVIRPTSPGFTLFPFEMGVRDGERLIGDTGPQGYLCWERTPGKTAISSTLENTSTV